MDRYDEAKHVHNTDDDVRDRDVRGEQDLRPGEVLGVAHVVPPKAPGDPSAAEEEVSGQHRDHTLEDETSISATGAARRTPGATSIDMGYGGSGTQIDED
jgi:hypothetical protein